MTHHRSASQSRAQEGGGLVSGVHHLAQTAPPMSASMSSREFARANNNVMVLENKPAAVHVAQKHGAHRRSLSYSSNDNSSSHLGSGSKISPSEFHYGARTGLAQSSSGLNKSTPLSPLLASPHLMMGSSGAMSLSERAIPFPRQILNAVRRSFSYSSNLVGMDKHKDDDDYETDDDEDQGSPMNFPMHHHRPIDEDDFHTGNTSNDDEMPRAFDSHANHPPEVIIMDHHHDSHANSSLHAHHLFHHTNAANAAWSESLDSLHSSGDFDAMVNANSPISSESPVGISTTSTATISGSGNGPRFVLEQHSDHATRHFSISTIQASSPSASIKRIILSAFPSNNVISAPRTNRRKKRHGRHHASGSAGGSGIGLGSLAGLTFSGVLKPLLVCFLVTCVIHLLNCYRASGGGTSWQPSMCPF